MFGFIPLSEKKSQMMAFLSALVEKYIKALLEKKKDCLIKTILSNPDFPFPVFCSPFCHALRRRKALSDSEFCSKGTDESQKIRLCSTNLRFTSRAFPSSCQIRPGGACDAWRSGVRRPRAPTHPHLSNQSANPSPCIRLPQYWSPVWGLKGVS